MEQKKQDQQEVQARLEYQKPEVKDYGQLQDLTESTTTTGVTDVPKGTPGPTAFS